MPGLVPGIHAVQGQQFWEIKCSGAAWMAGTSPAMTALDCINERKSLFACRSGFAANRQSLRAASERRASRTCSAETAGAAEPQALRM